MDFFKRAKVFRLKCGHHSRYLVADEDGETVRQSATITSPNALWTLEPVEGKPHLVRFRSSRTSKYLATTEVTFLTGMTGRKVAQRLRLDSSVEWELIKEGQYIKLKSQLGTLLRANPRFPPWSNSVTHDEPGHWTAKESMVLWIVDIVELDYSSRGGSTRDDSSPPEVVKRTVDSPSYSSNQVPRPGHSPSVSVDDRSNRNKKSDSSSKPRPTRNGLSGELPGATERTNSGSNRVSKLPSFESMTGLASNVAKLTFKELKGTEFREVLSLGQITRLQKAVAVLVADAKVSGHGNIPRDFVNLQERLQAMKKDYDRASTGIVECNSFSRSRYEARAEKKDFESKLRELEDVEFELDESIRAAKEKRNQLLKQLKEIENSIKDAERSQADHETEAQGVASRIELNKERLTAMNLEHKSWRAKKKEAERTLEIVEEDWIYVKNILAAFL